MAERARCGVEETLEGFSEMLYYGKAVFMSLDSQTNGGFEHGMARLALWERAM